MTRLAGVIFFSVFVLIPPLFAQQQDSPVKSQSPVISEEEPMDGPPTGMSMSRMMMGPQTTELYPTMINSSEPTPEELARMVREAKLWVTEGITMLTEGAAALTEATQQTDVTTMRLASTQIGEGLSRLESGLSTSQALERGKPPAEVALRWFKSQLNLAAKPVESQQLRFMGMTPFQLFICLLMLASIGISLVIYLLRMRRAYHLLERIDAGRSTETNSLQPDTALGSAEMTNAHKSILRLWNKKNISDGIYPPHGMRMN